MGKLSARKKIVKRRVEIGKVVPETVEQMEQWSYPGLVDIPILG
jgi:hypothetical protein